METRIIRETVTREGLRAMAEEEFGDMVKAVVDVGRELLAVGGDLHSDQEAILLEDGSRQDDLWGINLYPDRDLSDGVEFDSMINVRPSQGNRSREVEDPAVRERIRRIVETRVGGWA